MSLPNWEKRYNEMQNKVDKVEGKVLSSNDFTDEYKDKIVSNSNYISNILNVKWKNATYNSEIFDSGAIKYIELGNIVVVSIEELRIKKTTEFSNNTTVLATGLPTSVMSSIVLVSQGDGTSSDIDVRLKLHNGNIYTHWTKIIRFNNGGITGTIFACIK